MKICSKCEIEKDLSEFCKNKKAKDGYRAQCKKCVKEYYNKDKERILLKYKEYYENNKDEIKIKQKRYWENNKDRLNSQKREYNKGYNQRLEVKAYKKDWYNQYKEHIKEHNQTPEVIEHRKEYRRKYLKKKRKIDHMFKLNYYMGNDIRESLIGNKNGNHWESLVSFILPELITHLESLFQPGMTWSNHGDWHIDHIIPKSWFKFKSYTDDEFKQCWALCNLQPLWAEDNLKKGNRYVL